MLLSLRPSAPSAVKSRFTAEGAEGRIISGGRDGTVRVWKTGSGEQLNVLSGHTEEIWSAAFSPDGRFALSAGIQDKAMLLWNLQSGKEVQHFGGSPDTTREFFKAIFLADGRRALSAHADGTLRLWRLPKLAGSATQDREKATEYTARARDSYGNKQYAQATAACSETLKLDPENVEGWQAAPFRQQRRDRASMAVTRAGGEVAHSQAARNQGSAHGLRHRLCQEVLAGRGA